MANKGKRKVDNKKIEMPGLTSLAIIVAVIMVVALFVFVGPACSNAENLGSDLGGKMGTMVGNAVGSFNGITEGLTKGSQDGKAEGLSAKDTTVEIANNFSKVGNLEVLEAGVTLRNVNTVGEEYAALFLWKGVAIYSVSLEDAEIKDADTGTVEILLPDIDVEIYIDDNATEKLAEYQKHPWSGSAVDGFTEYMNSREVADQSIEDTIENHDALIEAAKSSAKKQVEIIAQAATGNKKDIVVKFKTEAQENE